MDPPWKVQNAASFPATLTVLLLASLCKINSCMIMGGILSQYLDLKVTIPDLVSVQCGLGVHIPCNFTYDNPHKNDSKKLYGYWFLEKTGWKHSFALSTPRRTTPGILVATNDKRQILMTSVENRFQLTGDPEQGNCSFSILNARPQDSGKYYFRTEDSKIIYSYTTAKGRARMMLEVLVTGF